jgi:hypothetical protein
MRVETRNRMAASPAHRVAPALAGLALLLSSAALAPSAHAHGGETIVDTKASELPAGPIKRMILDLQKALREEPKAIGERPVKEAVHAASRAEGARGSGDRQHGSLLDKLAEQWVKAGKALLRAVKSESGAAKVAGRARELATKVQRAEALLHEQQARLGRLRTELKAEEQKAKDRTSGAAAAEKARIEAAGKGKAAKKGKAP